jgi:hypothetical protein
MSQQEKLKKRQEQLKELINRNQRRLHELKKQKASFGLDTRPHILTEIEDIETELGDLRTELEEIEEEIGLAEALKCSRALVAGAPEARAQTRPKQEVDSWAVASVKSRLHALSEIVAGDAMKEAAIAAEEYQHDALTMLVPLIVDLRWSRGYKSGLTRLLKIPPPQKQLRDFQCKEVSPPCPVMDGLLSAEQDGPDRVLVQLDGNPAILIGHIGSSEMQTVLDSVNDYGRLGVPNSGGLSLLERIGDIPIRSQTEDFSELATALFRNREALIPLVARLGMPGDELLLPDEEEFPSIGKPLLEDTLQEQSSREARGWPKLEQSQKEGLETQVFLASRAVQRQTGKRRSSQEDLQKMLNLLMAQDPEKARQLIQALRSRQSRAK